MRARAANSGAKPLDRVAQTEGLPGFGRPTLSRSFEAMVYVVERYLPGRWPADLLPGLARLEPAPEELESGPLVVRYLGSTIVLGDEACFCQFEGPSEAAVAEANRMVGLPFDRIVPAVLVQANQRSSEMSVSTPIPRTVRRGPSHRLVAIVAIVAIVAGLAAWAIVSSLAGSAGEQPRRVNPVSESSVLRSLTPLQRQYVTAIASLSPATLAAAFGTNAASSVDAALAKLTPDQRRYVRSIASTSYARLAAGFSANPAPSRAVR